MNKEILINKQTIQMKKSELQGLIRECIHEVIKEEKNNKKKKALMEIKKLMESTNLTEEELNEFLGLGDLIKKIKSQAKGFLSVITGKVPSEYKKAFDILMTKLKDDQKVLKAVNAKAEEWKNSAEGQKAQLNPQTIQSAIGTAVGNQIAAASKEKEPVSEIDMDKMGAIFDKVGVKMASAVAATGLGSFLALLFKVPGLKDHVLATCDEAIKASGTTVPMVAKVALAISALITLAGAIAILGKATDPK